MIDVREILKDAEKCVLLKGRYDAANGTKTFSEYIDQLRYRKKCIEKDLSDIDVAIRLVGEMASHRLIMNADDDQISAVLEKMRIGQNENAGYGLDDCNR